jgi:hypothetical protein
MAELTPEERERIYLEEKARLEIRKQLESQPQPKPKPETSRVAKGCLWLIIAFVGLSAISAIVGKSSSSSSSHSDSTPQNPEEAKREKKHGAPPDKYVMQDQIERFLKAAAKNPDSVKVYNYSNMAYSKDDGWVITADWGAMNGFGGMNREQWAFAVSNGKFKYLEGVTFK